MAVTTAANRDLFFGKRAGAEIDFWSFRRGRLDEISRRLFRYHDGTKTRGRELPANLLKSRFAYRASLVCFRRWRRTGRRKSRGNVYRAFVKAWDRSSSCRITSCCPLVCGDFSGRLDSRIKVSIVRNFTSARLCRYLLSCFSKTKLH